jgi:hypothetical protein
MSSKKSGKEKAARMPRKCTTVHGLYDPAKSSGRAERIKDKEKGLYDV